MTLLALIKRNSKLFFKDKAMFFTSLITPMILLVLFATFLGNVYQDSFESTVPNGLQISKEIINGCVGGQLLSSLLAVCCVTVSFMSNLLMIQDKVTGARKDLTMSPVNKSTLALGYYISSVISSLIICYVATGIGFIYLRIIGWYLSGSDILLILLDVLILVLFGTALSSVLYHFLTSQGQMTAVGTIVSSCYGFLCGAYMPISSYGSALQNILAFLPGTYGTSLIRNHTMQGVLAEMQAQDFPDDAINAIRDSIDCNIYFFGNLVSAPVMYLVLIGAVIVLTGVYTSFYIFSKTVKNK